MGEAGNAVKFKNYYARAVRTTKFKVMIQLKKAFRSSKLNKSVKDLTALDGDLKDWKVWEKTFDQETKGLPESSTDITKFTRDLNRAKEFADRVEKLARKS